MQNTTKAASVNLDGNPNVSRDLLQRAADITKQLEKYGIDAKAGYNLAPALGGTVVARPPRPRTTAQNRQLGGVVMQADHPGL